jgi:hypothetical protein
VRDGTIREPRDGSQEIVSLALYGWKIGGVGKDAVQEEGRNAEGRWV